jgi:hypothetical protein
MMHFLDLQIKNFLPIKQLPWLLIPLQIKLIDPDEKESVIDVSNGFITNFKQLIRN